jgi:hypothetical protein
MAWLKRKADGKSERVAWLTHPNSALSAATGCLSFCNQKNGIMPPRFGATHEFGVGRVNFRQYFNAETG